MACEQASVLMGVALFLPHAPPRPFVALLDPPWLVDGPPRYVLHLCFLLHLSPLSLQFCVFSIYPLSAHASYSLRFTPRSDDDEPEVRWRARTLYMAEASEPFRLLEARKKQRNGRSNVGFVFFYIYSFLFYNAASRHLVPYSRDE